MTKPLAHLRRNAVAYLALFVALGGTSYAAVKLPAHSVGAKQLKKGAVTPKKLAKRVSKSLRGPSGRRGATGATGANGTVGAPGPAGTARAYAAVSFVGTTPIISGSIASRNVTGITKLAGTGQYCVAISPAVPLSDDVFVILTPFGRTDGAGSTNRRQAQDAGIAYPCVGNSIYVLTSDSSGTVADRSFSILIP